MVDFNDMVYQCMIKPAALIKRICAPLKDYLDVNYFGFCTIYEDGRMFNIANDYESLEFFYGNKLYFSQHYFRDPSLFQTGYTVIPMTYDREYQRKVFNLHEVDRMVLFLKKYENRMELSFFSRKMFTEKDCFSYFNRLYLFDKFVSYFKREAETLIHRVLAEGYDAKQVLGDAFYKTDPGIALLNEDLKARAFLNAIYPLSRREKQCLELFKEGYSAQATSAKLRLSQRTVEHHFERIKEKLGVSSKGELLTI